MDKSFCMNVGYFLHTSDRNLGGETIASVVITGISVVFVALIILIALVFLYGKIFEAVNARQAAKAEAEKKEESAATPKPVVTAKPAAAAPVVEDGIGDEVVAVISAAIAAYGAQSGKKLAIRSIKASGSQAPSGRGAWSAAGLAEATRPF